MKKAGHIVQDVSLQIVKHGKHIGDRHFWVHWADGKIISGSDNSDLKRIDNSLTEELWFHSTSPQSANNILVSFAIFCHTFLFSVKDVKGPSTVAFRKPYPGYQFLGLVFRNSGKPDLTVF